MRFILPYFIIILVVIQLYLKKSDTSQKNKLNQFLERERKANTTRKKDLTGLNYIKWDEALPIKADNPLLSDILDNTPEAATAYETVMSLRTAPMVNLTEYSNTDLKLMYGVANLELLTEYENNYTELIKSLAVLGHSLIEHNDTADAVSYLEYSLHIGSDIRQVYSDLKDIYTSQNNTASLNKLKQYGSLVKSVNKEAIQSILDN